MGNIIMLLSQIHGYSEVLSLYLIAASDPRPNAGHHITFTCHIFRFLLAVTVCQEFSYFNEVDIFKSSILQNAPLLEYFWCFSKEMWNYGIGYRLELCMGFCEKDNTGKVPVSSHPIKSAYYQYDLSLKKIFPYWAVPGLSDGMQDLSL